MVRDVDKPKQNNIASIMLLLPDPLGPDTVVNPGSKGMTDLPEKDLKLSISICRICIRCVGTLSIVR